MDKRMWLMALLGVFLVLMPVQAQGAGWTALLYDVSNGTMTIVNENGFVISNYNLPLVAGFDRYPLKVAVGHGGRPLAYVVFNSVTFQGALVVSEEDRLITSYALPVSVSDSTEFVADESLFNEDNSLVALGYGLEGGGWGIIVLNVITGAVDYSIRPDMPAVAVLGLPSEPGMMPVIRQFNKHNVTFNLVRSGTEVAVDLKGYDWNIDTNDLTLNPIYASLDSDRLEITNEVIMSLPDNRLSNESAKFPFFQANSLQVYDVANSGRYPFFNMLDASLQSPHFIQNGELILVNTASASGALIWTVLQRNGTVVGTLSNTINVIEVRGVQDGFVYLSDTLVPGSMTLVYVYTRDGLDAGVPVWTGATGTELSLVWAGGPLIASQIAYTPWTQLAEPVFASGNLVVAAPAPGQPLLVNAEQVGDISTTPLFNVVLVVGGIASINTTEGDQLNVRLGAGVNYEIVAKLSNGALVTLLEGPTTGNGFTWWKVRTATGIVGWVVESVDDGGKRLQTLVPQ
ncbi:MAG: SH3 domain-containing protein [Anaerolineae bacterium]